MLPRGIRNNNPGNLRLTPQLWQGEIVGQDRDFKVFETPSDGIRAIKTSLMKKFNRGLTKISTILNSYAPDSENDTEAYIARVSQHMHIDSDTELTMDEKTLVLFTEGIILHENGYCPYTREYIEESLR